MTFKRVLLTGASSGIGRALALALAAPGVTLHLGGRDAARLDDVAAECRSRGAAALPHAVGVTDRAAMEAWIAAAGPLDLVIANAGISGGTAGAMESDAQTRAIFATNLDGVLNTVLPAMAAMATQPPDARGVRGRIAVVASIAAFIPSPSAPAYCASKAAVDAWVVGAVPSARKQGIVMTSLCPGFVTSPMTAVNDFPMPGIMSAERAAGHMLRAIAAGQARAAFPIWMAAAARFAALLPVSWRGALAARMPAKKSL
ncbi:MAG TPA: SDR family NAD(P)-dependent oxidoreductase [Acidisoma sp.]|uniref:SDR family NAD(P)-dependent oxidoreductase n=1 Tax=Acidisoma sp. TaxID=1872115 RepID=UPI002BD5F5C8|nr:SDR family NAD(P)-dependent oxidoreductase [Acidisoma sp.]HTI03417.1 SDR family NAD(P)-dependent oxidoreductase [Acidisoma sp.]